MSWLTSAKSRSDALLAAGTELFGQQKYREAIAEFTEVIRRDGLNSCAFASRGAAHLQLGNYETAINDYTYASTLDPQNHFYFSARGCAYARTSQHQRAISDFTIAIKLNPDNWLAYASRSQSYDLIGQLDLAIADNCEAIAIAPDAVGPYCARARQYAKRKDYTSAINDLHRAHTLDSSSALVNETFADVMLEKMREEQSRSIAADDPANPTKVPGRPSSVSIQRVA